MELTNVDSILTAIIVAMARNRSYTFDKIVAILYASDIDADSYKVALALQKGLDTHKLWSLDEGSVTVFGLP